MPVIKLNSVTHKSGGEIEGRIENDYLGWLADQNLPDFSVYNLAICRLIMKFSGKTIQEYQSGNAGQFAVNFDDKSEIKLLDIVTSINEEKVPITQETFVRNLTEDEARLFLPVLELYQEAWEKENPSAPDVTH